MDLFKSAPLNVLRSLCPGRTCLKTRLTTRLWHLSMSLQHRYILMHSNHSKRLMLSECWIPGPPDSPLQVTLRNRVLANLPGCSALSYEWGSATSWSMILCNNKILNIIRNLCDLLKQLRPSKKSGCIWADAICINQDDLRERDQQVPLMRQI